MWHHSESANLESDNDWEWYLYWGYESDWGGCWLIDWERDEDGTYACCCEDDISDCTSGKWENTRDSQTWFWDDDATANQCRNGWL